MKNKSILLLAIFLLVGVIGFFVLRLSNQESFSKIDSQQSQNASYQSQTDGKGEVIVEARPVKLSSRENTSFDLKFTTHSVELSYDIKNITVLSDDLGNQYKPISWTGGSGGHHIQGILTFQEISKETKSIKLTIPGIDNQDRIFEWSLE